MARPRSTGEPPRTFEANASLARLRPPAAVRDLLRELWAAGHAAYIVGGSLRDALIGREPDDWDLATDARPERIRELFEDARYENRYGTVTVLRGGAAHEVTTFRRDVGSPDHRHPEDVEFGDRLEDDLARRDFTVNAMAWGGPAGTLLAEAGSAGADTAEPETGPALVDPFGGREDLGAGILRAVGEPGRRFEEDALRMLRAVRLSATLGFRIEPGTLEAIGANAELARHLSGERVGIELDKLLAAPTPSVGLRPAMETGLLAVIAPELARQPGVPQGKAIPGDLWDHTVRTVDAADPPERRPIARITALLHDIGKPATAADGHFLGHETLGAELAAQLLDALRAPRAVQERVARLVRLHMFTYDASWTDAAVRRFLRRVGPEILDDLLALREADNVGSGLEPEAGGLAELRARCHAQLASQVALRRGDLAIDGSTLIESLGLEPGPRLGRLIDELLERVIADPALNTRTALLDLAQRILAEDG